MWRKSITFLFILTTAMVAWGTSPAWLPGYLASRPASLGYVFPTNGLCVRFEFAAATGTNNLAEPTNNFSIVPGRGTTIVLGEGLITTNATGNCGTYTMTALAKSPETTERITISSWIKWKNLADRDTLLYGNSTIVRQDVNGDLNFYLYGPPDLAKAAAVCTTSAWEHLVMVGDGTNILIYVNGVVRATNHPASWNIVYSTSPKIGSDGVSDTAQFSMDSFALWSVAFSPMEVTNHFNGTKGNKL